MSEVTLFAIGFVLFIATTAATLVFAYRQFNELYRTDRRLGEDADPRLSRLD